MDNQSMLGLNSASAAPAPSSVGPAPDHALIELKLKLESRLKNGSGWFYVIAGLSLVNTAIVFFGSHWRFIFGLGITQIVDLIAQRLGGVAGIAALVIDAFIAAVFVLFGVFARKRQRWAFLVGMVLYGLDGLLILLLVHDILGVAFHAYAVWSILGGLKAMGALEQLEQATLATSGAAIQPR